MPREDHHLERGAEVLEHERRHEVAPLGVLAVERGDDAAHDPQLALAAFLELGQRALDVAAQRPLRAHHRVLAHVEAEHLLLEREPLRLPELGVGDLDALLEADAAPASGALEIEEAHRPLLALLAARDGPVDDLLEHEEQTLARVTEGVEAAGLDQ